MTARVPQTPSGWLIRAIAIALAAPLLALTACDTTTPSPTALVPPLRVVNGAASLASAAATQTPTCPTAAADYALVTFNVPGQNYVGMAGDGTMDLLQQRSMVHDSTSAAPGQIGDMVIVFLREPNYEHIDALAVGDTVAITDRACKTWHYTITSVTTVDPSQVPHIAPSATANLTLITTTPFWVDTQRVVWQAQLAN